MMERSQVIETMSELKSYSMKSAYDEILATAVKCQHEPQCIGGDFREVGPLHQIPDPPWRPLTDRQLVREVSSIVQGGSVC